MPTITYKGRLRTGANMGRLGWWTWGEAREVSAEWIESNKDKIFVGKDFVVEGYDETTLKSGSPDNTWSKGDIMAWLDEKEISYRATSTKKTLLAKASESLALAEETNNEAEEAQTTTGDDE